jgi:hypothetical protein
VDDYQYFLPRILELSLEDGAEWISSIEITGTKMRMAGFEGWTGERRSAINDLWLAVIREMASTGDDPELLGFISSDIESWLGAATLIPIRSRRLERPSRDFRTWSELSTTITSRPLPRALGQSVSGRAQRGQTEIANWLRLNVERAMS